VANVTVETEQDAMALLLQLDKRLEDWSDFWGLARDNIGKSQRERWRKGGMGSVKNITVDARQQGFGYYENPSANGVIWAKYFWTGALAEATTFFTWTRPLAANIDPHQNYRGPLQREMRDPFGAVVGHEDDAKIWDLRALDKVLEATIEQWLNSNVLPRAST